MTTMQRTTIDPTAHLSPDDIENLGAELDAIRAGVIASRGERDAAYIRAVIDAQRKLELSSRGILLFSLFPPAWLAGTVGLSISKIVENMEIGHNVMHGQWDWMRDPAIHSTSWEWDNASPADMWKHSHNELHHTYTNVIGKDNDLGYGIMRVDENQRWKPLYLVQPLSNAVNACFFQYGIAAYDLEIGKVLKGRVDKDAFRARGIKVLAKVGRHMTRDYVLHPLLSGPSALTTAWGGGKSNRSASGLGAVAVSTIGLVAGRGAEGSRDISRARTGSARPRPVAPGRGVESGRPTHAAATCWPSNPSAQASLPPQLVPVFQAMPSGPPSGKGWVRMPAMVAAARGETRGVPKVALGVILGVVFWLRCRGVTVPSCPRAA